MALHIESTRNLKETIRFLFQPKISPKLALALISSCLRNIFLEFSLHSVEPTHNFGMPRHY